MSIFQQKGLLFEGEKRIQLHILYSEKQKLKLFHNTPYESVETKIIEGIDIK